MKDIQSQKDNRRVDIRKVGVKTISYPIVVLDKAQTEQNTVANVNMYVNLPHQFKGTHMSRFIEILGESHGRIDLSNFQNILEQMKLRLHAEASHLEMYFPYFLQHDNKGYVSLPSRYECGLHGRLDGDSDIKLSLLIPVNNKALNIKSRESWGKVDLLVGFNKFYWIEDVISLVESVIEVEYQNIENNSQLTESKLAKNIAASLDKVDELKEFNITVQKENDRFNTFSRISKGC